jgi:hypothetical protein
MKLPGKYARPELREIQVGERWWTVPWAMTVDLDGTMRLKMKFHCFAKPGGTVTMPVERRADGFYVGLPADEMWERDSHLGFSRQDLVEVVGLLEEGL